MPRIPNSEFAPVYGFRGDSRPRFGWDRAPAFGGFGVVVTPGTTTYPSQDGTFSIVRGTGDHWGNGLIDGQYIIAGTGGTYYDLDSNEDGHLLGPNEAPRFKIGSELQAFLNDNNSREYQDFLRLQRSRDEAANPKLKAYDDALRAWAQSQQPPVAVDPLFGLATNFDMSQAPQAVQAAYADFTGHPIPQAPAPPPGPAIYLVGGITFEDDGTVLDGQTHQPTGQKLTPDQVHSLLTTGALPASAPAPSAPASAPAPSAPAPSAPAPPLATGPTLGDQLHAANPAPGAPVTAGGGGGGGGGSFFAPSGPASDVTPSGAPLTLAPGSASSTGFLGAIPLWGWFALGGGALLLMRRKGRR